MSVLAIWRDISVSKKLYFVVGVMGLLIAIELLSLRFAMHTLSSVRAFVGGEGLWSKSQKAAVLNLQKYAQSRDESYYKNYEESLAVPLGDRQARIEMAKPNPNYDIIYQGFLQGKIEYEDIAGLISLVRRFHDVPALHRALVIWEDGDRLMRELTAEAEQLHKVISENAPKSQVDMTLKRLDVLDAQLTVVENNFSYALGVGSRWLEHVLLTILFLAVLTVESTGLLLTISFSRNLSRGLKEISETASEVGKGDFTRKIPVRSKDELGQVAQALNAMTEKLENSIGGQKQAEKASEVKSLFLANMSHEIRTPLGAILGFAELLKEKSLTTAEREQYVDIILRTGNNLSKILHDILDLSKVEAGQIEIEKTKCSLSTLLKEVRQVMEIKCSEKNIKLTFATQGPVPETIYTDGFRLRQILTNMIGNAVKFTSEGSIHVITQVSGKQLMFVVEDTGVGLSAEQSKELFKVFSQADNSNNRKDEGTGLGLILSRRLANLLGGDVTLVHSEPGKGSVFSASVLLEEPFSASAESAEKIVTMPEKDISLHGKNILIVDDAPDNRFLIEKILLKKGFIVEQAVNGAEGMEKALQGNYDLVLMDVQMPVMDGYTAVSHLRAKDYKIPIIAITAHAMTGDRTKCLAAGYSDYLTKPIQTTEFFEVLRRHLKV